MRPIQEWNRRLHVVCLLIGMLLLPVAAGAAEPMSREEISVKAAEKWLDLIDRGKFSLSWDEAAEYFRNAVTRAQWEQSLNAVRKPLGKTASRNLKSTTFSTSLPGAPDGEYVVIEFETTFEKKKSAIETVTPMLDKDGTWRVSGYYIR